ncbi:MAG: RNase adapter RapZ [Myxococcota bacterium]
MRIVVITGTGGSGKTNALRALEDAGFYAIDNLPIRLLDDLVALFGSSGGDTERLALVIDARMTMLHQDGARSIELAPEILEATRTQGHEVVLVYLDASTEILERRYSETRRRHPLSTDGTVLSGILNERSLLAPLRQACQTSLDTGEMSVHDLRRTIQHALAPKDAEDSRLSIGVMSFGFKYGVPPEADLVFDARFIQNPYFVPELRSKTGLDQDVVDYVRAQVSFTPFLEHLQSLLGFLLPEYEKEGKAYLTIAIGCTGGRHRSVVTARDLHAWLSKEGFRSDARHRDVAR